MVPLIILATTNLGKVRELEHLFMDLSRKFRLGSLMDYSGIKTAEEDGKTFMENSMKKAVHYSLHIPDLPIVGEDSGLEVSALGGEPGVKSARYAGPNAGSQDNVARLLQRMKNQSNRRANFISVLTLAKNGRVIKSFTGEVAGEISYHPKGDHGFGYDPVFFYPPSKKTFAQLSARQKNAVSHRFQAFKQLREFLVEYPPFI